MKKIEIGTIARTVVLVIALVNYLLTASGKNPLPFAESDTYGAITDVLATGASIVAW